MKNYGLIFDMDNTILDTHIDFNEMHRRTSETAINICKTKLQCTPPDFSKMATAQIIQWCAENGFAKTDIQLLWQKVSETEAEGMKSIVKEDGIEQILTDLQKAGYYLTVLTNNSLAAAKLAIKNSALTKYFQEIHARDEYEELKPSPVGIDSIMKNNPQIKKWLMIGDSWLDGEAAKRAGIAFAAYGKRDEAYWRQYSITPDLWLKKWDAHTLSSTNEFMKNL